MIIDLIKKYKYFFIVGIVFSIFKLYKFFKSDPSDKDIVADDVLSTPLGGSTVQLSANDKARLKVTAQNVAVNLGTSFGWANPRNWFENDEDIFNALKGLTQLEFNYIAKLYKEVYAKGRDLSNDLSKHLDSKYYELLIIK